MKHKKTHLILKIVCLILFIIFIVLHFLHISYSDNKVANELIKGCVLRGTGSLLTLLICVTAGLKKLLCPRTMPQLKTLMWCIPCVLVAVANFPFSALITGSAKVTMPHLLWLFALYCLLIGTFEELIFRVFFQSLVYEKFKNSKYPTFTVIAVTSAGFALLHLLNLLDGADVLSTLLQIGYSFLLGAMLSAIMIKTGNVYLCILIHALFDFGGFLVPILGTGTAQDSIFWILTIVCGVLCFGHIMGLIFKMDRKTTLTKE